jgi:hypothetical protein
VPTCIVHRLLSAQARAEAARLRNGDPGVLYNVPEGGLWVDAGDDDQIVAGLIAAALEGAAVHLNSARGLLLGGTGSINVEADAVLPFNRSVAASLRDIPEPAKSAMKKPAFPLVKIRELIEAHRRQACVFSLIDDDGQPSLRMGRIGGLPLLPTEMDWPLSFNRPVEFVAQLPLDSAAEAGFLPFKFESGSWLTIFWGADWWEPHPSTLTCPAFVLGPHGLTPKQPPAGSRHRVAPPMFAGARGG